MMNILCGIDIIDIDRIKRLVDRRRESSLLRLFTKKEIEYCRAAGKNYAEKFAGKFAVKEAVLKVFGIGIFDGITMNSIEILNNPRGKPYLYLKDKAQILSDEKGILSIDISISHTAVSAIGFAVALCK